MNKKKYIIIIAIITIVTLTLLLPLLEIKIKLPNKFIVLSYNIDYQNYEQNSCYDESYFYYPLKNISLTTPEEKHFLLLNILIFQYKEGNVCKTEYLLTEDYITNFLENAVIKENNKNIDLAKLIENKTPIVSNAKYYNNNYDTVIDYKLNNKHQIMYIFYQNDLLIIQVGNSDEGPKYIAYK